MKQEKTVAEGMKIKPLYQNLSNKLVKPVCYNLFVHCLICFEEQSAKCDFPQTESVWDLGL